MRITKELRINEERGFAKTLPEIGVRMSKLLAELKQTGQSNIYSSMALEANQFSASTYLRENWQLVRILVGGDAGRICEGHKWKPLRPIFLIKSWQLWRETLVSMVLCIVRFPNIVIYKDRVATTTTRQLPSSRRVFACQHVTNWLACFAWKRKPGNGAVLKDIFQPIWFAIACVNRSLGAGRAVNLSLSRL